MLLTAPALAVTVAGGRNGALERFSDVPVVSIVTGRATRSSSLGICL